MSQQLIERIDTIYRYVRRAQANSDVRSRVTRRQEEMLRVELVGVEQARLYDLNEVVATVVADALPVCRTLGVRLRVWQAIDLPRVPLLVEPLQHALAGLIDLCLDDDGVDALELRTWSELDCVVASVEREVGIADRIDGCWRELSPGARVELLVGAETLRALGGAMSIRGRGKEMRCRIELPRGDSSMPLGDCDAWPQPLPAEPEPYILHGAYDSPSHMIMS